MRGTIKKPTGAADVAQLLSQAASLSSQAADLAQHGQVDEALMLEQKADELRKQARKIASDTQKRESMPAAASVKEGVQPGADRGLGARAATIAALGELSVPSSPRTIADYAWARYGTRIDHRALPSLRRDEARSWSSTKSIRPVYVVPALEGNRFLPVRAKLALSDWPLERRMLGPWSERTDHLRATVHVAKQLAWLRNADPQAAARLELLLATYVASSFGTAQNDKSLDPAKVERAASAELETLGESDSRWRIDAAERARSLLSEEQLLWGASLPRIVAGRP
jgi:hypothetical protein